jgi:hypothetical protein
MIEDGGPNTSEVQKCYPKCCARPTEGSHGLTPDDPAQRFKGKKRRPRYKRLGKAQPRAL